MGNEYFGLKSIVILKKLPGSLIHEVKELVQDVTLVYESSQNPIFVATPLRFLRCYRRPEERNARRDLPDVLRLHSISPVVQFSDCDHLDTRTLSDRGGRR